MFRTMKGDSEATLFNGFTPSRGRRIAMVVTLSYILYMYIDVEVKIPEPHFGLNKSDTRAME